MHDGWEVGRSVVVMKRKNKEQQHGSESACERTADSAERRSATEGNPGEAAAVATLRAEAVSTGLERIRQTAKRDRSKRFTCLLHHITPELLAEAYFALNRKAGTGVDGVTWKEYGKDLLERVEDLHARVHAGRYRAKPSKRIWIPKPDGRQRPIGIAALEDKVVQMALVWVLQSIYEEDFKRFSYGFRPGCSAHNALDALYVSITQRKVSWVLDADIRGFFDNLDHQKLEELLRIRIGDKRVLRLIMKFLRAGVSEEGEWSRTEVGTPQGAVISPLLANVYLHYVLDEWVSMHRKTHARGEVHIVRYADDFVMCFQYRDDAVRWKASLSERLGLFGLELHPEKTRLIEFGRFAESNQRKRGVGKPESFDFLGFTHRCGRRRSDGGYALHRVTVKKRLRAKLQEIKVELRRRMHHPPHVTGRWLRSVITGYLNYAAVPGNRKAMELFRTEINRMWVRTLRRRSQKARDRGWEHFSKLIKTWIPSIKARHPYPNQRLIV